MQAPHSLAAALSDDLSRFSEARQTEPGDDLYGTPGIKLKGFGVYFEIHARGPFDSHWRLVMGRRKPAKAVGPAPS